LVIGWLALAPLGWCVAAAFLSIPFLFGAVFRGDMSWWILHEVHKQMRYGAANAAVTAFVYLAAYASLLSVIWAAGKALWKDVRRAQHAPTFHTAFTPANPPQRRTLNAAPKACLWLGILAFVLLGLYSPWVERADIPYRLHFARSAGYSFIWSPPPLPDWPRQASMEVNLARLGTEWLIVGVVTAGLAFTLRKAPGVRIEDDGQPDDA
jgi:hypothetical protein